MEDAPRGANLMKQNLCIALCLFTLVAGSLYVRSGSSYAAFVAMGGKNVVPEAGSGGPTDADGRAGEVPPTKDAAGEGVSDAAADRTLEDVALDKRIAAQRDKNERTYRESGITGNIPSEVPTPRFGISELTAMFDVIYGHMNENPDIFSTPTDDTLIKRTFDPRIDGLLYGETKGGVLSGFASEDLIAWDVKKKDGTYTILVLTQDAADGGWRVLTEGDVYKLRKEMTDGD
jgi:hypothetical protein